jgi:hypothetical protein
MSPDPIMHTVRRAEGGSVLKHFKCRTRKTIIAQYPVLRYRDHVGVPRIGSNETGADLNLNSGPNKNSSGKRQPERAGNHPQQSIGQVGHHLARMPLAPAPRHMLTRYSVTHTKPSHDRQVTAPATPPPATRSLVFDLLLLALLARPVSPAPHPSVGAARLQSAWSWGFPFHLAGVPAHCAKSSRGRAQARGRLIEAHGAGIV